MFSGGAERPLNAEVSELRSDLIQFNGYLCYVSNGSFFIDTGDSTPSDSIPPGSSYPYGRLASIHTNGTAFLYHQVNESVIMEEMMALNQGTGAWLKPNMISVPVR